MISTKDLYNKKVYIKQTNKCLGKARAFIFCGLKCDGIIVNRPDFLLMFHRKPVYIKFDSIVLKNNNIFINGKDKFQPISSAPKKGFEIVGAKVKTNSDALGKVSNANIDEKSNKLKDIETKEGSLSNIILGKCSIDSSFIKSFSLKDHTILLKDNAEVCEYKEGLANKAGKGTSYVIHKIKKSTPKVVDSMQGQSDKIHTMFKDFKDEIKKGME